jgi:hypothetical protein
MLVPGVASQTMIGHRPLSVAVTSLGISERRHVQNGISCFVCTSRGIREVAVYIQGVQKATLRSTGGYIKTYISKTAKLPR